VAGEHFRAGDLVEVRSKDEILSTLDGNGRLDGLPFMPEMLKYCGQQFRVRKRAHKTCDFVTNTGSRRLRNAVHLEDLRCDGAAHGGCQAECVLFWKEAWLRPISSSINTSREVAPAACVQSVAFAGDEQCVEQDLWDATREMTHTGDAHDPTYVCQATLLPKYTETLHWWDVRQYIEDYRSGNVRSVRDMLPALSYRFVDNLINLGIGVGPPLRWLYDRIQRLTGGHPYPARAGKIRSGERTPVVSTALQPGELVKVKNYSEILDTIDENYLNRGMSFGAEMAPYCGGTFRVHRRVDLIINEKTGKMLKMKTPCIMLEGVVCTARYNPRMIFCPRATYAYWREIWLDRLDKTPDNTPITSA